MDFVEAARALGASHARILVRHVLATQLDDPEGLVEFDHPMGYRYESGLTTETADGVTHVSLVARRA